MIISLFLLHKISPYYWSPFVKLYHIGETDDPTHLARHPSVLAIGAHDREGVNLTPSITEHATDILCPGEGIFSTRNKSKYSFGPSMLKNCSGPVNVPTTKLLCFNNVHRIKTLTAGTMQAFILWFSTALNLITQWEILSHIGYFKIMSIFVLPLSLPFFY